MSAWMIPQLTATDSDAELRAAIVAILTETRAVISIRNLCLALERRGALKLSRPDFDLYPGSAECQRVSSLVLALYADGTVARILAEPARSPPPAT